jgi:hypothetical protein
MAVTVALVGGSAATSATTTGRTLTTEPLGAVTPVVGADLVWPGMLGTCRFQNCRQLGCLGGAQRDGTADYLQVASAVAATHDDLGTVDASDHPADDYLNCVAVLDP